MVIDAALLELMPSTVTLSAPVARNAHNEWTYGAGTGYRCRVVGKQETFTDANGKSRTSVGMAVLGEVAAGVTTDWKMVLPDGTRGWIYAVDQNDDESGPYNTTIYFGRAY